MSCRPPRQGGGTNTKALAGLRASAGTTIAENRERTLAELPRSELDLVVAGTADGVLMVESEARELSEDLMLGAVTFGHREFQPVIQAIIDLAETCAREPWDLPPPSPEHDEIEARLRETIGPLIEAAYREQGKQDRSNRLDAAKAQVSELFADEEQRALASKIFKDLEKEIVRGAILRGSNRHVSALMGH